MPRNPAPKAKKPKEEPNLRKEPETSDWSGDDANPAEDVKEAADRIVSDTGLNINPGVERGAPDVTEEPKLIKEQPPAPPVQVIERRIETVIVEIPLGETPHRIRQVHLNLLLNKDHAQTFARLRQGLRDKGERTEDGRKVDTTPDVVRWLLEQFASC